MKRRMYFYAVATLRFYILISIFLVIVLLFASLPPLTSPASAQTSSVVPTVSPSSLACAPLDKDGANENDFRIDKEYKLNITEPGILANAGAKIETLIGHNIGDFLSATPIQNTKSFLSNMYNRYNGIYQLFLYKGDYKTSGFNHVTANVPLNQINGDSGTVLNQAVIGDLDGDGIPDAIDTETIVSESIALSAGDYSFINLIISDNATLTLNSNSSLPGFKGVHIIADSLTIESGSSISADGKGYGPASGPGAGGSGGSPFNVGSGGGGGYGGNGGAGQRAGGTAYGSLPMPTDLGSGGGIGDGGPGGAGGGAVRLDVSGTLTINGTISANGNNGSGSVNFGGAGGSGGSIYIITNTLTGSGAISACGGSGALILNPGGGGSGGRIAIYYSTNSYTGTMLAYGGAGNQYGGAGTVFTKSTTQAHGDLLLDNNSHAGAATPVTGANEFDNITIRSKVNLSLLTGSALVIPSLTLQSSSLTLATGSTLGTPSITLQSSSFTVGSGVTFNPSNVSVQSSTITNGGNLSWTTINFQGGTIINNGAISAPGLALTNITLRNNGTMNISDISVGNTGILEQNSDNITLANLTISSGGILSHTAGDKINLTISNNLTIEPGGSINVNGKGYGPASGPGAGGSGGSPFNVGSGGGGGYGGNGGAGQRAGGTAYGSLIMPTDLGSGGGIGDGGYGGAGGGAVRLDVSGTLTINGTISANGNNGSGAVNFGGAGGSGGSIYIIANTLTGSGTISARGGSGAMILNPGGGGGGGRIAIYYSTNSYTGTMSAYGGGGASYGGAGTVFTKSTTQAHGNLLLDNNGHSGAVTPVTGANQFNNVTILSGCILNCAAGDNINLTVSHDLLIEAGGSINVNSKGYAAASGPGKGGSSGSSTYKGGGGAGYGGNGGSGTGDTATGGTAYGSLIAPIDLGSGGGNGSSGSGGSGGGVIRLDVSGTLTVNGSIYANGAAGSINGGGGSGGSIYITTNSLIGNGIISANGGNGGTSNPTYGYGGGGGGGRIAIYRNTGTEFPGNIVVSGGTGYAKGQNGTINVSGLITATEQTCSQSNLIETLLEQTLAADNITATGDLNGAFIFTDFKMVGVKTGSFANNGFFKAEWQANLEGKDYTGIWQGMFFLNQVDNRIYLKGRTSGEILAIIDGYLAESVAGSGIYNQFQISLEFSLAGTKTMSGTVFLNGTVTYQANHEYPSTQLYVLQTSLSGTSLGSYNGSLDVVITHVRIADNNNPYYGQGFSVISYTSDRGSGTGYTYGQLVSMGQLALSGVFNGPLLGMVSGVLDESKSPRTLSIIIERTDLGVPPMADLSVKVWSQTWVSSGQTVNYIIEYRNDGAKSAENVVVVDQLDYAVNYVSSTENGIYWPLRHEVFWKLGTLAPQETGYLTVQVKIKWGLAAHSSLYNTPLIDTTSDELNRYLHPEYAAPFNIEEYLSHATMTSAGFLTEEEFDTEMLPDPEVLQLYNYFVGQGYTYSDGGVTYALSDNTTVNAALLVLPASDNTSASEAFVYLIKPEEKSPIYLKISSDNPTTFTLGNVDGEELSFKYSYDPSFGPILPYRVEVSTTSSPISQYPMSNPTTMLSQNAYSQENTGSPFEENLDRFVSGSLIKPGAVFAESPIGLSQPEASQPEPPKYPELRSPESPYILMDEERCDYDDCMRWNFWKNVPVWVVGYVPYVGTVPNAARCAEEWADCWNSGGTNTNACIRADTCSTLTAFEIGGEVSGMGFIPGYIAQFIDTSDGIWGDHDRAKEKCNSGYYDDYKQGDQMQECISRQFMVYGPQQLTINGKDPFEGRKPGDTIDCIVDYHFSTITCDWVQDGISDCCDAGYICIPGKNLMAYCTNGEKYKQLIAVGRDPNIKYGPEGIVAPDEKLDYKVEYENIGEGIAFGVYFTDTLDESLDASTLQIGPIIDPDTSQNIADPGIYNPGTRTITWYAGEVGPNQGGYAEFNANVKADAPDGKQIINFATVYFPSVPEVTPTNGIVSIVISDQPRILVEPTSDLLTTEDGGENLFLVVLQTQPTADVTINLSSDDPSEGTVSPASLTFTPDNWNQPQMVTVTGVADGIPDGDITYHIITAPAVSADPRYSGLDSADVTVVNIDVAPTDNIPPVTQIQVTPSANENGWNNSDITVNLTAADNEGGSGIKEIHYQLSGAIQDEQTIPADTVSLTISNEGTTTLTYYSIDNVGNQEAEQSYTLKLDKIPPTITASPSPQPNSNGWNNTDVIVTFSASDNLSGIESVTEPTIATTEGAAQEITGEAIDFAGNRATSLATVRIDKTPPVTTASSSPQPNNNSWNNTDVTVTFSATDDLSGIESISDPITVTTEGAEQNVSGEAIDLAGNKASTSATVSIDKTPPVITTSTSPDPNLYGWNNTNVTVTFNASDELSGLESVTQPVTVTTEGTEQNVTGEASDCAGNKATASVGVSIDKTPPVVIVTADPSILWPPNHKLVGVAIGGSASDNMSDIGSTTFAVIDEYATYSPTLSGFNTTIQLEAWREGNDKDGRLYTILVTTRDKADNESTSSATVICPHDQGKK